MQKKNVPLSLRLDKDTAEKFKTLAQQKNLSQSDFFKELLDSTDISKSINYPQPKVSMNKTDVDSDLFVYILKDNSLTSNPEQQKTPIKKYCFNGRLLFNDIISPKILRPAINFYDLLVNEFYIDTDLHDLNKYELYELLNVYKDSSETSFLVHEMLGLRNKETGSYDLYLQRCKYVSDLINDLQKEFPYAYDEEIRTIQAKVAPEITKADLINYF